jgi:hypothetical protein
MHRREKDHLAQNRPPTQSQEPIRHRSIDLPVQLFVQSGGGEGDAVEQPDFSKRHLLYSYSLMDLVEKIASRHVTAATKSRMGLVIDTELIAKSAGKA